MIATALAALIIAQATTTTTIVPYRENPTCGAAFDAVVSEGGATPRPVHAGSTFVVALKSNPSTGYGWRITSAPVDATWQGRQYVADAALTTPEPTTPPRAPAVGGGGTDLWLFTATAPGTATVTLGLYPPGRTGDVRHVAFTIPVLPAVACPADTPAP